MRKDALGETRSCPKRSQLVLVRPWKGPCIRLPSEDEESCDMFACGVDVARRCSMSQSSDPQDTADMNRGGVSMGQVSEGIPSSGTKHQTQTRDQSKVTGEPGGSSQSKP